MHTATKTTFFFLMLTCVLSAPTKKADRQQKSLSYFGYVQPSDAMDYNAYDGDEGEDYAMDYEENALSRTIPKRKKVRRPYNSPIYYIRLPPQPYMFVQGLGYVSQAASNPAQPFLNLEVPFVNNGKPSNIYQWSPNVQGLPTVAPPPPPTKKPIPSKPTDSTIHRLPGQFTFNGKPEDIFVLRDNYDSFYNDALQSFYP
ncbi:PREDICTED: uncharacterized protein LOC108567014 [Nicrophorus vespilloides]|uniref:Uncharacterized protein LOC108567014 n=1 Tax=Nicrophorus vespilloides TaxID=110193 RepID=A0ABM1N785_NICVS|nr:PREDICTED: uncharacterized protein LOC108567014 [Nicrophorus vespilloides]